MQRPRRILRPTSLLLLFVTFAPGGIVPRAEAAQDARSTSAEYLYELGVEYRRAGHLQDAAHELRKALLVDPAHARAARELNEIQLLIQADRERAMRQALSEAEQHLARAASKRAIDQVVAEQQQRQLSRLMTESATHPPLGPPPVPRAEAPPIPAWEPGWPLREQALPEVKPRRIRVPNPWVNGASWFYVFGPSGNLEYGALDEPLSLFVDVPRDAGGPVTVRVLDADIRGRHDEQDGGWDTSTAFRLSGGAALLDSEIIGPESRDGTTVTFGPFPLDQGEPRGEVVRFRFDADGIAGDDNNLFALEVSPAAAQVFAVSPAIRLADQAGAEMRFFPGVPALASRVVIESNYDLDADGGRAWLIPAAQDGRALRRIPLAGSGSGTWASTVVDVPFGADGTRWTYRIVKGTQRKANMAFRLTDGQGGALPIYATRGRAAGAVEGRAPRARLSPEEPVRVRLPALGAPAQSSCAAFTFDASGSTDPDNDQLSFRWDFGDGTSAAGIMAQHTYAAPGDYRVVLEVSDGPSTRPAERRGSLGTVPSERSESRDGSCPGCGCATAERMVRVNLPPTAVLEAPAAACAGDGVRFSAAGSSDSPAEPLRYRWDFGDGTTAEGAAVTHAYGRGGDFQVRLTVDDGRGTSCSTDTTAATIRVNSPPVAKADPEAAKCAVDALEPLSVILSAIGSSDPDFDPLSYRWDFGDGATAEGVWISHPYARGGRYTATLTVDDGAGTACSTAAAVVPVRVNRAPRAALTPPAKSCPGEPVAFDALRSSDPDGDALTYRWDFGDRATGEGATATHRYAAPGRFPVTVTVDDGSGMSCGTDTASATASVNAPPVPQLTVRGETAF